MSRGTDRRDKKRVARAWDDLQRAFARGDAELCVSSFAELGSEPSAGDVARGAALVRDAVSAAHRSREWARLASLGIKLARSGDRLLDACADDDARSARWSLLWGFALTKDWERARRAWSRLEADARTRLPALADAVAAWLEGSGAPEGDTLARFEASAKVLVDPRLGLEATPAPRVAIPSPRSADEVAPSVARVLATSNVRDARRTIEGWLAESPTTPDQAAAIAAVAAELGLLTARRRSGADRAEALALVARSLEAQGAASFEVMVGALRLCLRSIEESGIAPVAARIVQLAAREARTRSLLVDAFGALDLPPPRLLPLVAVLADLVLDAALWVKHVSLVAKSARSLDGAGVLDEAPVHALERGLRRILDRAPASADDGRKLAAALSAFDAREQRQMLTLIAELFDGALVARFCEAPWEVLDAAQRRSFAEGVAARFDCSHAGYCDHCDEWHGSRPPALTTEDRALWAKVAAHVAPYELDLLVWWSDDQLPAAVADALRRFVAHTPDVRSFLDALELAHRRAPRARDVVITRMLERFAADTEALAYAVIAARLDRSARPRVAAAFLAAVESSPAGGVRNPLVLRALSRLDRAKKAKTTRKRKRAAATLELPLTAPAAMPAAKGSRS